MCAGLAEKNTWRVHLCLSVAQRSAPSKKKDHRNWAVGSVAATTASTFGGKGVTRVSIELCFGVPSELEAQGTPVCSPISWGLVIIKHALVMLVLAQPQPLSTPGYFSLMGSQLHTCCLRTPM